ncbi:hypothetical protein SO694_00026121 [Aureococcus anophagefferens]|uniref:Uncharacterized protein n=1 Tax=Aureococcus anophagefferens TaxID=44056 RepID=A0ABR1FUA3_AURAN
MDDDDDEDPYNFDLAGDDDLGYGDDDSASMSYSPARRAPAARPAPESKKAPVGRGARPASTAEAPAKGGGSSASDILAKASAMLSKKPASYGGGRRAAEKESTVDDILAGLSSDGDESEASRPRGLTRQTSTLGRGAAPRAGSRSFDLGSLGGSDSNDQSQSFDQGSLDKPRPTISPSPEADRRRLRDETRIGRGLGDMPKLGLARKSVYGDVRTASGLGAPDPARSPDPEPAAREGGTRWRELEDAPLTATTKGDLSSSRRGTVRSINDLNDARAEERAGAPPTRDSESTFDFGGRGDGVDDEDDDDLAGDLGGGGALEAAAERALLRSPEGFGAASALPRRAVENSSPPRGKPAERPGKPGAARRTVSFDGDGALSSDAAPLHSSGGSPGGALEESLAEDDSDGDRTVGQRDAAGSSDSGENYEGESVADDDDAAPNAPNVRSFSDLAAVAAPESSDGDDDAEEYSDEFGNESPASRSPRSGPGRRTAPPLGPPAAAGPPPARLATPPSSVAARATAGAVVRSFDDLARCRGPQRGPHGLRGQRAAATPPAAAAAKTRRVRSHAGHVFFTVRLGLLAIEHLDGTARDVFVADVAAALGVSRRASTSSARESLAGDGSVLEARVAVRGGADARALGAAIARVRGDDGEVHFDFAEGAAPRAATADAGAPRARVTTHDAATGDADEDEPAPGGELAGCAVPRAADRGRRLSAQLFSLADQHLAELHAERAAGTTALNAPDAALPQMLAAQADLSRQLEGLRAKLAESRATYDAARARPPSTEAHHTLAATQEYIDTHRPAPLPYWKAYMSVDASLTEEEARQLAFDDVKHKRGAAAPVSAVAATTASAAAGPDGPDGGVGEAKEG